MLLALAPRVRIQKYLHEAGLDPAGSTHSSGLDRIYRRFGHVCKALSGEVSHPIDLLTPSSPEGLPTLCSTIKGSWVPWGSTTKPLISPLANTPWKLQVIEIEIQQENINFNYYCMQHHNTLDCSVRHNIRPGQCLSARHTASVNNTNNYNLYTISHNEVIMQ